MFLIETFERSLRESWDYIVGGHIFGTTHLVYKTDKLFLN